MSVCLCLSERVYVRLCLCLHLSPSVLRVCVDLCLSGPLSVCLFMSESASKSVFAPVTMPLSVACFSCRSVWQCAHGCPEKEKISGVHQ